MTIKVTYNVTDIYVTQDVSPVYINVSYSGGGSVGAAVWGGITGTLSNQTDLQNALNAKFDDPTGTTSQYLRGDGSLATFPAIPSGTVQSVGLTMPSAFSVANSPITSSGTLAVTGAGDTTQYIAGDGSLVAFPITGQAGTLVREVRNVTGATLTKGTVVYINGASGNKPTVAKALATGDATSAQTFGLIQADIPNNSNGYLVAFGDLDGLNTSAFAEGVQLYLSATTAGGYTSTKQYAPNHLVYIGVVTRQHVNQGRIEVRIQNGYELDELHDVAAQTPSNNDGLFYNSTNSLWENKSIATALGYTPANAATTLTINGVTYDLSTSRTWSVGSVTGSGASGQVAYWTGTSAQSGSNNLFWDAANGRLGIGTNAPSTALHVVRNDNSFNQQLIIDNPNSGANAISYFTMRLNSVSGGGVAFYGANYTNVSQRNSLIFYSIDGVKLGFISNAVGTGANQDIYFATKLNNTNVTLFGSTGNLLVQNGGTHTDSGERLQVTGTMKVTGASSFGGNMTLTSGGSTSGTFGFYVLNSATTQMFGLRNDGKIVLGTGNPPTNASVHINIPNGYVNINGSYSSGSFLTYQALGQYDALGADTGGTILAIGGYRLSQWLGITLHANGNEVVRIKSGGQVRFLPLASAPSSPQAGDVYYDSTLNKLRVYTTAWETITSV